MTDQTENDWDFYFCQVEDQPASIFVNLALASQAPLTSHPHWLQFRIHMKAPRLDGLSSDSEAQTLFAIEDSLLDALSQTAKVIYAGRVTHAGFRDIFVYVSDPAPLGQAIDKALSQWPDQRCEIFVAEDPQWQTYLGYLYPNPAQMRVIQNRRVISILQSHNDDLSVPRELDHMINVATPEAAMAVVNELQQRKYIIRSEEGAMDVDFFRSDALTDIDDITADLEDLAAKYGGNYDGWGCEVQAPAAPLA